MNPVHITLINKLTITELEFKLTWVVKNCITTQTITRVIIISKNTLSTVPTKGRWTSRRWNAYSFSIARVMIIYENIKTPKFLVPTIFKVFL